MKEKKKILSLFLLCIITILIVVMIACPPTGGGTGDDNGDDDSSSSSSIDGSSSSTSSETSSETTSMLDDFDDASDDNLWGGRYFTSEGAGGEIDNTLDAANGRGGTGNALRLDVTVDAGGEWSCISGYFAASDAAKDISSYEQFIFWVKGSVAGLPLKIVLDNDSGGSRNTAFLHINDYLDGGITTNYQEVKIPLDAFCNLDGLTNAIKFNFAFVNNYDGSGTFQTAGSVYIDDISFTSEAPTVLRIDYFGDEAEPNALGGEDQTGDGDDDGGVLTTSIRVYDVVNYHDNACGMDWNFTLNDSAAWAFAYMYSNFGGGTGDWPAEVTSDFSSYSKITFWLKSDRAWAGSEKFEFKLKDEVGEKVLYIPENTLEGTAISTTWTKYTIPLTTFTGLDTTVLKQYVIGASLVVVGDQTNDVHLYFDEIQFEK
ncbi:MAG: hypothetical protein KAT05_07870 [Spirochaetes bacterium]|nr:hypothetical protein [Spirochaetota bacterium]